TVTVSPPSPALCACSLRRAPIERSRILQGAPAAMTPEAETVTLDDLRRRLSELDRQLIALVAERKAMSEEVARVQRATGRPTRARRDFRCGIAQVAAAGGPLGAEIPRLPGDLGAPDVRARHRAALGPPRAVRRPGERGRARRGARAVRLHHGRAGGDEPRRP